MVKKLAAAAAAGLLSVMMLSGVAVAEHDSEEDNIHHSTALATSSNGALGWSCPSDTVAVDGGHHAQHDVDVSEVMEPNTEYPHHETGPNETGWWVQNGETPQEIVVWVECATPFSVSVYELDNDGDLVETNDFTAEGARHNDGNVTVWFEGEDEPEWHVILDGNLETVMWTVNDEDEWTSVAQFDDLDQRASYDVVIGDLEAGGPSPEPKDDDTLPPTGLDLWQFLFIGGAIIAAGTVMLLVKKRQAISLN